MMAGKKKGASSAPRPRSGFATEEQRHTVRVRVPKEPAEILAKRWRLSMSDAVIRAVVEAAEQTSNEQGEEQ